MSQHHSRAGLTLVELLVAIFLATLLIGAIAGTSIQVQEAINTSVQRELAAQQARTLFRDIETDLGRMIVCDQAPAPFDVDVRSAGAPQRPIELERVDPTSVPAGADPYPLAEARRADRLRLFTSFDGPTASQRQVIEYLLDQRAGAPDFQMPPGSGYWSTRLRRQVWKCSPPDAARTYPDPGPICVESVASFQLDWVDAKADATSDTFQAPTGQTSSGDEFVREGTFNVADFTLTAMDAGAQGLLGALPVGGGVRLTDPGVAGDPGTTLLVRRKNGAGPTYTSVLLSDRLDARTGLKGSAFLPPTLVRVTLTIAWGKGSKSETGRFIRSFPVPR